MIEARGLSKRYGQKTAVADLNFQVRSGMVTGFLGPNGSGKSTTMRMILGLDAPTSGSVTIGGLAYRDLPNPTRTVGALLDAKSVHGGRSARAHLLSLAQLSGIPNRRVDEVLAAVGLQETARKRAGGFSLGMGQRLGIAAALLGDPEVLLFDEPVNGLDPEGVLWIRNLMRGLAAEGRTVFVSSHLMSEMALTADHLVIIGRGRLLADMSLNAFIQQYSAGHVRVRPQQMAEAARLAQVLGAAGGGTQPSPDGAIQVTGLDVQRISDLAHEQGIRILELAPQQASLEEAYMQMTQGAVEYRGSVDVGNSRSPQPPYQQPQPGGWNQPPPQQQYAQPQPQPQPQPQLQPQPQPQPQPPQQYAPQGGYPPPPGAYPGGPQGYGGYPPPGNQAGYRPESEA